MERDPSLLEAMTEIAGSAAGLVVRLREGGLSADEKADGSPVTEADRRAERLIVGELAALAPDIPAIAEEAVADGGCQHGPLETFWLVDPIDGTRAFVRGSDEFTVNIALIRNRRPVLGVVAAPAMGTTYRAGGQGTAEARRERDGGGWRAIGVRPIPPDGATLVSSRSFGDSAALEGMLRGQRVREHRHMDSSIKFCLVASGEADLYPRYGPTSEWDTAAGHAVLAGAGGAVQTRDGRPLRYGKAGWRNPGFVARGGP